jgi:hypothetical protein
MKNRSLTQPAAVGLVALLALAFASGGALAQEKIKKPEPGVPEIFTLEGATVRGGVKSQKLMRGALSLETPDHTSIPLASQEDYMKANLRALDMRAARVVHDSINYFPPEATQGCRIGFFKDISRGRGVAFDEVELSSRRACLGRIYFQVPGGIKHGQHWLNVKFEESLVRVPFRILTEEEEKEFSKTWQDIKKEHEKAFKK